MTKEQSFQLKGVAILFMIWGHLFGNPNYVQKVMTPLLLLGDEPLVSILARATGPVAFFLFLSGYGLFCSNHKRKDVHRWVRIMRLLIIYWIFLFVTISVGYVLSPDKYSVESLSLVLQNFIGLNPTFIPEAWFMLPYILLAITASWEYNIVRQSNSILIVIFAFFLNLFTSFLLSRFGADYLYPNRMLYIFFCWFHFQFPFVLGMITAKSGILQWFRNYFSVPYFYWFFFLVALVVLRCMTTSSFPHVFYVFLFVIVWTNLCIPKWLAKSLQVLGRESVGMWFCHTSLGLYLFSNIYNGLQYPLLIYLSVCVSSWILAKMINYSITL